MARSLCIVLTDMFPVLPTSTSESVVADNRMRYRVHPGRVCCKLGCLVADHNVQDFHLKSMQSSMLFMFTEIERPLPLPPRNTEALDSGSFQLEIDALNQCSSSVEPSRLELIRYGFIVGCRAIQRFWNWYPEVAARSYQQTHSHLAKC